MTPTSQRERFEFLRQIPLFAELDEPDLRKLCSLVGDVRLAGRARSCSARAAPASWPT